MSRFMPLAAGLVGWVVIFSGLASAADPVATRTPYDTLFFTDFDTDGDPWTLDSFADTDSARWFNLIMETPDEAPLGVWYWAILLEPHCGYYDEELGQDVCWYVCAVVDMEWDSTYVTDGELTPYPEPGCHWNGIQFSVAEGAPMEPHHRYVIGRGLARPDCGPAPPEAEYCTGERPNFRIWFKAIDKYTNEMNFGCPNPSNAGAVEVDRFGLEPIRPNPVRDRLSLSVKVEPGAWARVTVHDVAGRMLRTLHEGEAPSRRLPLVWDLRADPTRREVGSGVYFVRLESSRGRQQQSFVVLR